MKLAYISEQHEWHNTISGRNVLKTGNLAQQTKEREQTSRFFFLQ